ncbi:hypothetical protein ACQ0P8_16190 (plasmid) [Halodesulfovibrio aestuarii]|uniref:Uncharacterized protein n=1 Tax=Halodesulfovibrio aestuarii TaxID=126333 RepID=A0A8G2CC69_9BACT|nr:hypothetical protein [Halodesulfovibrio aestuarii]SHJ72787.1 hypothetical protein SAMN05660830_03100 [Halodesulfovibrio aestuarii]
MTFYREANPDETPCKECQFSYIYTGAATRPLKCLYGYTTSNAQKKGYGVPVAKEFTCNVSKDRL